jgi:hypothetical protein
MWLSPRDKRRYSKVETRDVELRVELFSWSWHVGASGWLTEIVRNITVMPPLLVPHGLCQVG